MIKPNNPSVDLQGLLGFLLLIVSLAFSTLSPNAGANAVADETRQQQRREYQQATKALAKRALGKGNRVRFKRLEESLRAYPLHPYLLYGDIASRLRKVKAEEMATFLNRYQNYAFADTLRKKWLTQLAARKQWPDYVQFYDDSLSATRFACHYSYALFQIGENAKASAVGLSLWQQGKSQPKSCDPAFKQLISKKLISNPVAWRRYTAAIFNHNYSLANYISRFFTNQGFRQQAKLYMSVDRNPRNIGHYSNFARQTPEERQIIVHGLSHLAKIKPLLALKHWNRYHQSHKFSADDETRIVSALVKALYRGGHEKTADNYLQQAQEFASKDLLEWRLRELIKEADWAGVLAWSNNVKASIKDDDRWQYWRIRATELMAKNTPANAYQSLAKKRSFYGFLASEWSKSPYDMQHQPLQITDEEIKRLANSPAFIRIRELHYHQELYWARKEWNKALDKAPDRQWQIAARLAEQWQWHHQAIVAMIKLRYWNDIDVRFPLAHKQAFIRQAQSTDIPLNVLFALSRQESSFNASVTSPAGAKGLMQLMPATAKETARKHGIAYKSSAELFDPDKNILIGSKYYQEMLKRFNNNKILATAAYNAGPHRVNRWQQATQGTLPFDAWIEIIPFRETRNYVQSVLAFSIIYAHHLGLDVAMLDSHEKNTLL